ncbi:UDP-2,3-diacylglucosamine diphosphatase [Tunicatimonas pelagia]|uniref:UDP-2,3-diacylglucosamine diphosphatase n=1 Tax=Tunicatimonas pelagia TaxID=931531 RepID=UPI00266610A3|nr:UDP-2,3-diacylglucosamine diphosphatase [Tunicatimonas pelagia]WKN41932.1 UDP-2,3-diacylglucosamine diphosphatase [Tunicatimonas pelagia]
MISSTDLLSPIQLPAEKKLYFASDFHLGAPNFRQSKQREQTIVRWLETIRSDAHGLFLLGDIFDFWFEYRHVVPKGFLHLQSKLIQLLERGIFVVLFTGNHDLWMFDYFEHELGVPVVRQPISIQVNNTHLHIGHGDGLGPGDRTYKFLKKIFTAKIGQVLFSLIHPDLGIAFANSWSRSSRKSNEKKDELFRGKEHEWIYHYCREIEANTHHDYYVFGHRHLPLDIPLNPESRYYNLGEWITQPHYGVLNGKTFELRTFQG